MVGYNGFMLFFHVSVHLSVICPSIFVFQDDNWSECQWIFTKLGLCIAILEIWFGIANGKFCQFLKELSAHDMSDF